MDCTRLTRRRDPLRPDSWLVYCADIHAGTIAKAVGMSNAVNHWNWCAGFYPGSRPGEIKSGCAETFNEARFQFERAWRAFASTRSQDDFATWREHRDWTAAKYAARDAAKSVPIR